MSGVSEYNVPNNYPLRVRQADPKTTGMATIARECVQEFARKVLANKEDYSATQVKRANFARNAAGWKKQFGGMTQGSELELHPDEIQALIDQGYGIEYLDKYNEKESKG